MWDFKWAGRAILPRVTRLDADEFTQANQVGLLVFIRCIREIRGRNALFVEVKIKKPPRWGRLLGVNPDDSV